MATKAYGRMVFWEGACLWLLGTRPGERYPATAVHSHHAVQVTLGLRGSFRLEAGNHELRGEAVAVAPDVDHVFDAEADSMVAQLFIDPEGRPGREILRALLGGADLGALPVAMLR